MAIDLNDDRFAKVEADRTAAIQEVKDTYNGMIQQSDDYYGKLIQESKDWANTQTDIQNANTQFAIDKINQDKAQAQKDYEKEQSASYVDYQKQLAGDSATQVAAGRQFGGGYTEGSRISMWNTYQNRVASAKESYNKAVLNYNNNIKEAQLANNSAIAQIAHDALQQQLQLSLQGFQYKNELTTTLLDKQLTLDNTYYNRYQDVVNQINTENAFNESKRQWEAEMAYKKERDAVADAQWQESFNLAKKGSGTSGGYSGGGGVPVGVNNPSGNDKYGNSTETQSKDDYYFSNGYQPRYYNDKKLNAFKWAASGKTMTVSDLQDVNTAYNSIKGDKTVWSGIGYDSNGKQVARYYVWSNKEDGYIDVTSDVVKVLQRNNKSFQKESDLQLKAQTTGGTVNTKYAGDPKNKKIG